MDINSNSNGHMHYINVNQKKLDILLQEFAEHGAEIEGANPWGISFNSTDPVIQVLWEKNANILTINVVKKEWINARDKNWTILHSLINGLHSDSKKEMHDAIMNL